MSNNAIYIEKGSEISNFFPAAEDLVIIVSAESIPAFKSLVARGINCWDQAPPEIKQLQEVLSGRAVITQREIDYRISKIIEFSENDI